MWSWLLFSRRFIQMPRPFTFTLNNAYVHRYICMHIHIYVYTNLYKFTYTLTNRMNNRNYTWFMYEYEKFQAVFLSLSVMYMYHSNRQIVLIKHPCIYHQLSGIMTNHDFAESCAYMYIRIVFFQNSTYIISQIINVTLFYPH
jgi:hypothetical protein